MSIRLLYSRGRSQIHDVIDVMIQLFCGNCHDMMTYKSRYFGIGNNIVEIIKEISMEMNDDLWGI
jgi:hypothetical protein